MATRALRSVSIATAMMYNSWRDMHVSMKYHEDRNGPVRLSFFDCLATVCMRPEVDLRMLTMKDL